MATQGKIEFEHLGIGDLLKRNRLRVPLHQREFSWEEKQVVELFDDLASAINDDKPAYFLGTIVLTRTESGGLEVIDGQQRLATVTILLAAVRDYFHSLRDDLLTRSLEEFLHTIVRESRETAPRLTLNVDDNEYFRRRIIPRENEKDRKKARPSKPSHELIEQAAVLAAKHVQAIVGTFKPDTQIAALNQWVKYVQESAQVILAIAPDQVNAFIMFETLNDRGLRTTQADLLKNYLFSTSGDRIDEAQHRWSEMKGTLETLGDDVTLTYLRHLTISLYGYTREREVLEKIKSRVRGKLRTIDFLDTLNESASDYVAIHSPEHTKWNSYGPSIREHVKTLGLLRMTPMRPLMLSVSRKFSRKHTEKAFKRFVCWSVRLLIAGGGRSGRVEQGLAHAAEQVSAGKIANADKLLESLKSAIPSDADFEEAFAAARISQSYLARYLLRSLELKRKEQPEPEWIPNDDIAINLEHILPGNPGKSWSAFDSETASAYHKRIGNMALMQASRNSVAGNASFAEKSRHYKESTFILTCEVTKAADWTPSEISERQKRLAKLAVKTWPLA